MSYPLDRVTVSVPLAGKPSLFSLLAVLFILPTDLDLLFSNLDKPSSSTSLCFPLLFVEPARASSVFLTPKSLPLFVKGQSLLFLPGLQAQGSQESLTFRHLSPFMNS